MSDSKQLKTLLKTWEIEEQKVLQYKLSVEKITKDRERLYLEVLTKKKETKSRISDLGGKVKKQALQKGDKEVLQSALGYKGKLEKELKLLDKDVSERLKEFNQALERSNLAEKDWIAARIEKKKIEKLLEKKRTADLVFDSVKDEIIIDEFVNRKSK